MPGALNHLLKENPGPTSGKAPSQTGTTKPMDIVALHQSRVMHQTDMVYIVPPMVYRSYIKAINVVRVFATGWKHLQSNNGVQLYISDHVDWKAILKTIENVKPKEVWTTHGSGKQLQAHFETNLVVKLLN